MLGHISFGTHFGFTAIYQRKKNECHRIACAAAVEKPAGNINHGGAFSRLSTDYELWENILFFILFY